MQSTDKPSKFLIPWANSGSKRTIPKDSQIGITAGAASLTDGFPPLTFIPTTAGGKGPSGLDMNGILNQITAADRWAMAGGGYAYDSDFSTAIGGYPKGAIVSRTDGNGYWISQAENNTTDPEVSGSTWRPNSVSGSAAIALTNANVTLTNLQAGFDVIILSGTLTANVNLVFPAWVKNWTIINNCSGSFTVTTKTSSGSGVAVGATAQISGDGTNIVSTGSSGSSSASRLQTIGASVASNALTLTLNATTLDFRSSTLSSGSVSTVTSSAPVSLVVPSSATLGTISAQASRLVLIALNNAGTIELAVVNISGGNQLDETNLISTTAISSGSTAANVVYSTTARTGVAYRVVGFIDITEATAGTWSTAPTSIQGVGGQALAAMSSLGFGQTLQNVLGSRTTGVTYYNTTGKPIVVMIQNGGGNSASLQFSINGTVVFFTIVSSIVVNNSLSIIVPHGFSYSCTTTVNSPSSWIELR